MTISKFKFNKKKKATEPANEYVLDDNFDKNVSYRRRPSFLSQPPVQTPPDLLGENGPNTAVENLFQPGQSDFPIKSAPWKKHKIFSSPFPRYRHSASSVSSEMNEIYIMGGLKDGSVFGDTWKIVPQISPSGQSIDGFVAQHVEVTNNNNPPARVGHASVLCGNAYIIYGGDTVETDYHGFPDDNFYMFNINNCKYTVPLHILNKPKGRYGHLIGVVLMNATSSRLYLFGGQLENDVYNDIYFFELNSFKLPKARWELIDPLNSSKPPPLTNHTMNVHKHKIYVFGGIYNNEKVSNDLWCFDTLVSKWLQIQTFGEQPKPVNEHSACIVSDILYIYGGNDFSGTIYDTLYALDLKSYTWSKLSKDLEQDGPGPRCGHTMSFIPKLNKLVIMGGDKNDYCRPGKHDYETYEESNGHDAGTMIFELDLATANHFMNTLRPSKRAVSAGGAAGLISRRAPSPLPSEDAFTRHRRSLSGYDEYKTPNGSSEHLSRSLDPKIESSMPKYEENLIDKFVEVPSSTVSAKLNLDDQSDIDESTTANRLRGNELSPLRDDATEDIQLERDINNDTPILTKDFAHLSGAYHPDENLALPHKTVASLKATREEVVAAQSVSDLKTLEMKALVEDLRKQVSQLQSEKKAELEQASLEIDTLKSELAGLRISTEELKRLLETEVATKQKHIDDQNGILLELKSSLGSNALEIGEDTEVIPVSKGITELTRYKILHLELQNKLTHVENENSDLREKQARFEPFMNNQINELSSLQKIIKAQEDRISFLISQVKLELVLLEKIAQLEHQNENLEMEFNKYKILNAPLDVSDDEQGDDEDGGAGEDLSKKGFSGQLSSKLEDLVSLWHASTLVETSAPEVKESAVVSQLQKQIEELTLMTKTQQEQSAAEVTELKSELETTLASLRVFEENYRDAMQAAQRTGDALDLTKDELQNKKNTIEKLMKENDELKLFNKSRRVASSESMKEDDGDNKPEATVEADGVAAHYNMKIKEMQAELFVMKNENEHLSSTVSSLKKELYLARNQD